MSIFSVVSRLLTIRQTGMSLVEILIYTTVFSIASAGIFAFLTSYKSSWIQISNNTNQAEQADFATKYIQTQLGQSDSVTVASVNSGDNACLQLRKDTALQRSGTLFGAGNDFIETALPKSNLWLESVSVSFWLRIDASQTGIANIVNWGSESHRQQFAIQVSEGLLKLDFNGAHYVLNDRLDLRDSNWHHIAVTYDSQNRVQPLPGAGINVYIDNKLMSGLFSTQSPPNYEVLLTRPGTNLFVGSLRYDTTNRLIGAVSDLRIWDQPLAAADINNLATGTTNVTVQPATLRYHWPLQSFTSGQRNLIGIGPQSSEGVFNGAWIKNPIVSTVAEKASFAHYCFYDQNQNGLYELWASKTATIIPKPAPQTPDWQRVTEDMFIPKDGGGFFNAISKSPDSVTANFALGTKQYNQPAIQQKKANRAVFQQR